ncbi:conserved hypothetical protein [uncultured delta proteobacterium]|uniref:DUF5681 domain-containing protein n=1 Tax=uncultured delta proteobacterium TaxID=34034 RepID=A0A212K1B0_9DELT|nr:conserved hypothetical protein [uncultured delta proteobacterium]
MSSSENTGKKQTATRFKKGQSGNPAGKPKGALNKATLAAQTLLGGEVEALTRKAVELALEGNIQALKLCLERLLPPCKERPLSVKLPVVRQLEDLPKLTAALISAVGSGKLTAGEAAGLSSLAANHAKSIELVELEKRITALEGKTKR